MPYSLPPSMPEENFHSHQTPQSHCRAMNQPTASPPATTQPSTSPSATKESSLPSSSDSKNLAAAVFTAQSPPSVSVPAALRAKISSATTTATTTPKVAPAANKRSEREAHKSSPLPHEEGSSPALEMTLSSPVPKSTETIGSQGPVVSKGKPVATTPQLERALSPKQTEFRTQKTVAPAPSGRSSVSGIEHQSSHASPPALTAPATPPARAEAKPATATGKAATTTTTTTTTTPSLKDEDESTTDQSVDHLTRPDGAGHYNLECKFCGKLFTTKAHVRRHERIHTGEKPFQCKFCEKRFNQRGNLNVHERTHTGERPFQCRYCLKRFTTSSYLHVHERAHVEQQRADHHKLMALQQGMQQHSQAVLRQAQQPLASNPYLVDQGILHHPGQPAGYPARQPFLSPAAGLAALAQGQPPSALSAMTNTPYPSLQHLALTSAQLAEVFPYQARIPSMVGASGYLTDSAALQAGGLPPQQLRSFFQAQGPPHPQSQHLNAAQGMQSQYHSAHQQHVPISAVPTINQLMYQQQSHPHQQLLDATGAIPMSLATPYLSQLPQRSHPGADASLGGRPLTSTALDPSAMNALLQRLAGSQTAVGAQLPQ